MSAERLVVAERIRTGAGADGDAVLLRDDRVAAVGRVGELRRPDLPEDRYPGGVILPGLWDAHFHPFGYAAVLTRPSLKSASDLPDLLERLGESAARLPARTPLVAHRLDDEGLIERRLPTRHDLDPSLGDRPVLLLRYCGHVGVANTAALERAGVGPDTPDPPGGSFERDDEGRPTGVLRETALDWVADRLRGPVEVTPESLLEAMTTLTAFGLTGIGGIISGSSDPSCGAHREIRVLEEVASDLPLRMAVLVVAGTPAELQEAARRLDGGRLRFLGLKGFADGSLGGRTAALRRPYHDRSGDRGILRLDTGLPDVIDACLELGGKVAVHAIGDLANARVLDLFEPLIGRGAEPTDLRVEHASVLGDAEVERLARTGVTASVQPSFLPSETAWLEQRLGSERLPLVYRFRTMAEAGIPLAGGSDCPVEPPSPWRGMAAARDRAGIVPEEGLHAADALALFTEGAARASGAADPLRPGSPADLVIVDRDPVEASPEELRETTVLSTWVDGSPLDLPEAPAWRD